MPHVDALAEVRELATRLRAGHESASTEAAARLAHRANHENHRVRQAVAEACDHLDAAHADPLLAQLQHDSHAYVARAARRILEKRAVRKTARNREDETDAQLADLLNQLGAKSKATRKLAERAIARERENFVRRLFHELAKVATPLEVAIHRIASEAANPQMDRAAIARDAETARERFAFLWSIVESARAYASSVTPKFAEERLRDIVDDAREQLVERMADSARLDFVNDVDDSLRIDAHRFALLQALQNVLQNGVEAYPADAARVALRVGARRDGAEVILEIRDEGAGMSEEQRARLFVPFASSKPRGTGVGLLIARKMVEDVHGGTLEIESAKGAGTTVRMRLAVRQR